MISSTRTEIGSKIADARRRWPHDRLVVLQLDDDVLVVPLGHVIMMSTEHVVINVLSVLDSKKEHILLEETDRLRARNEVLEEVARVAKIIHAVMKDDEAYSGVWVNYPDTAQNTPRSLMHKALIKLEQTDLGE